MFYYFKTFMKLSILNLSLMENINPFFQERDKKQLSSMKTDGQQL